MALQDYLNSLNDYELESKVSSSTDPENGDKDSDSDERILTPEEQFSFTMGLEADIAARSTPAPVEPVGQYLPEDFGKYKQDYDATIPEQLDDLSEYRGATQSIEDKWGNGLLKFGGKTLTNVVGGLGNVVYGGALVAKSGELNQFYNNEFSEAIDDINTAMDENLPNHYTKLEREKNVRNQLGTANFWADKVMNGLSFVAGAALTEVGAVAAGAFIGNVAGATALGAANALRITAQASRLLKSASMLNRAGKMGKTLRYGRYISRKGKLGESARVVRQLLTGASYEAGVEARHAYDTIYANLQTNLIGDKIDAAEAELGRPLTTEERDNLLTPEQRHSLDNEATSLSNGVFVTNFALVGGSNIIMLPKMYGLGSRRAMNKLAASGTANIPKTTTFLDRAVKSIKLGVKTSDAIRVGKKVAGRGLYEGFVEEGGQGLLQRAASDYALVAQIGDSGELETNYRLAIDSALEGGKQSYTTTEGLTEVMIGTILGLTGLPGSTTLGQSIAEVKSRRQQINRMVTMAEEAPSLYNSLKSNSYFFQNVQTRSGALDAAYESGNMAKVKDLEHDNFFDYAMSKIQTGQFADIAEQADEIQNLSDQKFMEMGDYTSEDLPTPEAIQKRKSEVVRAVKERSEKILEATNKVDSTVRMTAEEKVLNYAKAGTAGYLRMQLIHNLSVMDNVERREKDLTEKLGELTGGQIISDSKKASEVSSLKYTDSEGNSRIVKIGGFNQSMTIEGYTNLVAEQLYAVENLDEIPEDSREAVSKLDPVKLRDELNYLHSIEDQLGADTLLSPEEYLQILQPARQLESWKENNPEEAAINEQEVINTLIDLRYLRARRQKAALQYRNLLDPTTRQEAIQKIIAEVEEVKEVKKEFTKFEEVTPEEENAKEKLEEENKRQLEQLKIKLNLTPSASPTDLQRAEIKIVESQEAILEKSKEIVKNSVEKNSRYRTQKVFTTVKDVEALITSSEEALNTSSEWLNNSDKDIENIKNILSSINEIETQIPDQTVFNLEELKKIQNGKLTFIEAAIEALGKKMSTLKSSQDLIKASVEDSILQSENDWNSKDPRWSDEEMTFSKETITKLANLSDSILPENSEEFYTTAVDSIKQAYDLDVTEAIDEDDTVEEVIKSFGSENYTVSPEKAAEESVKKETQVSGIRPDIGGVGLWHTAGRQTNFRGREGAEEIYARLKDDREPEQEQEFKQAESQLDHFQFIHHTSTVGRRYAVAAVSKKSLPSLPKAVADVLKDRFYQEEDSEEEDIKLVVIDKSTNSFVKNEHGRFIYTSAMEPFIEKYGKDRFTNKIPGLNAKQRLQKEAEFKAWRDSVIESEKVFVYDIPGKSNGSIYPKLADEVFQNIGRVAETFDDYKNIKLAIATSQKMKEGRAPLTIGKQTVIVNPGSVTAYNDKSEYVIPMIGRPLTSKEAINTARMVKLLLEARESAFDNLIESSKPLKNSWKQAQNLTVNVGGKDINVFNALNDIVYTERTGKYAMYFNYNKGKFIYGKDATPIGLEDFDNPEAVEKFEKFLTKKYHNTNTSTLDAAVEEIHATDEDGTSVRTYTYRAVPGQEWGEIILNDDLTVSDESILWSNYNEYLLMDRKEGLSPLRTRIQPISSQKNIEAYIYEGGYLEFVIFQVS